MSFEWGRRTYVMGIVNVTPDSFSGDGRSDIDDAVKHGVHLAHEGAHILDVGGESTRPGSTPVSRLSGSPWLGRNRGRRMFGATRALMCHLPKWLPKPLRRASFEGLNELRDLLLQRVLRRSPLDSELLLVR